MKYHSRAVLLLAFLAASPAISPAFAGFISRIADPEMVEDLNGILSITRTNRNVSVVIFRTRGDGECDPGREDQTCPSEHLLIAVAGQDEGGARALYRTNARYTWKFRRWVRLPAKPVDEVNRAPVVFEALAQSVSPDGAVRDQHYLISVTPWGATMTRETAEGK